MRSAILDLINSSIKWWLGKRPIDWSEKDHLANPEINSFNTGEKDLCRAIAAYIKNQREQIHEKADPQ